MKTACKSIKQMSEIKTLVYVANLALNKTRSIVLSDT